MAAYGTHTFALTYQRLAGVILRGAPAVANTTGAPYYVTSASPLVNPTVTSCSPAAGTSLGGVSVTLTGDGFAAGATVRFGSNYATSVVVVNATTITCVTPSGAGSVPVIVRNADGGEGSLANGFVYSTGSLPTSGLVSNWPMNGDALDVVSTNHGSVTSVTYATSVNGLGAVFNGTSSRIVAANPANFRSAQWTVGAVLKGSFTGEQCVFESWDQTGGIYAGFQVRITNAGAQVTLGNLTGFVYISVSVGALTGWAGGDPRHLVASFDGSRVRIYFQGVLVLNQVAAITNVFNTSTRVTMGIDEYIPGLFAYPYNGTLSKVCYWNRVLSDSEVLGAMVDAFGLGTGGSPAVTPPIISNITPTPGTELTQFQPVSFKVTDDTALLRGIVIAQFPDSSWVAVCDGDDFAPTFRAYSTRTVVAGGFQYSVVPDTGWQQAPTLRIIATDTSGNETS